MNSAALLYDDLTSPLVVSLCFDLLDLIMLNHGGGDDPGTPQSASKNA